MKCFMSSALCRIAALSLAFLAARQATAVPITLNLVQADSHITIDTVFGGIADTIQDGTSGTTDGNAASPSNRTTFQGTITVNVDDLLSPSSIQIVSSAADADVSGNWFAQVRPYQDLNGNGDNGEFNLPPAGDSEVGTNSNFGPSAAADWGTKIVHPAFGVPIAYGGYRDISYNVTSAVEPVALGTFSSLSQELEPDGFLDYWVAPGGGGLLGRTEANTGDDYNNTAGVSSYVVTPLGGGLSQITLTIPIQVDDMGDTLRTVYTGQFVATAIIPEPSSLVLLGAAAFGLIGVRRSR